MSAAATTLKAPLDGQETRNVTLLELVTAVSEVSRNDREVVATVLEMLRSGRVRLRGNFCGHPIEDLC